MLSPCSAVWNGSIIRADSLRYNLRAGREHVFRILLMTEEKDGVEVHRISKSAPIHIRRRGGDGG